MAASLASALYRDRAIPPASPWLDTGAPPAPSIALASTTLTITPAAGEAARWWIVRSRSATDCQTKVVFGSERSIALPAGTTRVVVNALDAAGNTSPAAERRQ